MIGTSVDPDCGAIVGSDWLHGAFWPAELAANMPNVGHLHTVFKIARKTPGLAVYAEHGVRCSMIAADDSAQLITCQRGQGPTVPAGKQLQLHA